MKQLGIIFKYEFLTLVRKKSFIVTTILFMLVSIIGFSIPSLISFLKKDSEAPGDSVQKVAISASFKNTDVLLANANTYFAGQYEFVPVTENTDKLITDVENNLYEFAVFMDSPLSYTRIVGTTTLYDNFDYSFNEVLLSTYRYNTLKDMGLSDTQLEEVLSAGVSSSIIRTATSKNAEQNFLFSYVMILIMYMLIVLYGSMVASSVATEKSTRAMELLITSAKPTNLMFGKVLGTSAAALSQFTLIVLSAVLSYRFNKGTFADTALLSNVFDVDISIYIFFPIFLILGFLIYAFIFAALASLVSRMEDLNTVIQPAMFINVIAMMVVIFSVASGAVNNPALIACSFIPLTSPMAMFARICMADVATWEIALSLILLVASTYGIGVLAAGIYKLGVLLYGNPPKIKNLVKMIKNNK